MQHRKDKVPVGVDVASAGSSGPLGTCSEAPASQRGSLSDPIEFVRATGLAEPILRKYLSGFAGTAASVDDILQATWLRAWEHRHRFSARGSTIGWLFRICQSVSREARESHQRLPTVPLMRDVADDSSTSESGEYARVELDDARLELISRLPKRRREIVLARFDGGMSIRDIGQKFGCRPGTVKATLHQARDWLRQRDPAKTLEERSRY